jgi:hypothetical protein
LIRLRVVREGESDNEEHDVSVDESPHATVVAAGIQIPENVRSNCLVCTYVSYLFIGLLIQGKNRVSKDRGLGRQM